MRLYNGEYQNFAIEGLLIRRKNGIYRTKERRELMQILKFDEFIRSLKQNKDTAHSFLLGAGASVESGIPSASDCIWDWKHEIFLSQNPSLIDSFKNVKVDNVRVAIQNWLDNEETYPKQDSDEEYSFYAEKTFPIEDDRRKYFQHFVENKEPSLGYHLIAMLAEIGWIKSVWTTNFDGLIVKAAHKYNLIPIEITLESQDRIHRGDVDKELLCVALHGDYKYGTLRNTATELDVQSNTLINALKYELSKRNLIVMGYSGRDKSLMSALKEAYLQSGVGRLYWCGYGANCPPVVEELLKFVSSNGRQAFYIPTDGFDKTMLIISKHCMSDDVKFTTKIDTLLNSLSNSSGIISTDFQDSDGILKKIVKTNIYPISFPQTCYQFKISYLPEEKPWNYCKALAEHDIIAVPYNDMTFAWGNKQTISKVCSSKMTGNLDIVPFTRDFLIKNSTFKEMLLRALTSILGKKSNLSFSKDRIWDTNKSFSYKVENNLIYAYLGVQLSLVFDYKYTYISIAPTYHFRDSERYSSNIIKQFSDNFSNKINKGKPNLFINNYVDEWISILTTNATVTSAYPIDSNEGFNFLVRSNSALVGVKGNSNSSNFNLPNSINERRIIFNGVECYDPELIFFNSRQNKMLKDFHPMRGLINNNPFDYSLNEKVLRSSINIGVLCPNNHSNAFYAFLNLINNHHPVKYNIDFVLSFPGFFDAFKVGLNIPTTNSPTWIDLKASPTVEIKKAALELGQTINNKLEQLSSFPIDLVLIYIPKEFEALTSYTDEMGNFDLHDFVKAYAVQKSIATQFVREKTLDSDLRCQIMWALSLAIYVKSCRIPWVISNLQHDTAFAGIGYSLSKTVSGTDIVVGCSHIYSSDGRGLKYKLAKINDVTFDHRQNPYLSEEESYRLGLNIKELFYKSFTELPKRVVIHKRTPFRSEEIDGIVKCLSTTGINDIVLLEINYEDNIRCFEFTHNFSIDGFPVRRGLCFPLNNKTMLIYTHGIAPSVRSPNYKYIQGGKTIPLPLKVVKHYGNGNMTKIATEILGLSKMNWNSFGLYTKLPCTIESSNEIARIGRLLSQYEGAIYDYRFFM